MDVGNVNVAVEPSVWVAEEALIASHPYLLMRQALRSGNAARVHCLLAGGAGLPALSRPLPPSLAPLILEACCGGDIDCVQMLLEREPSLASAVDPSGTTPVHAAAARGDVGIVQELLQRGASASLADAGGFLPLHAAAARGRRAVVDVLLGQAGTPVDVPAGPGVTALLLTCEGGHVHCAELLLSRGAQVNVSDASGLTPLLAALAGNHPELATLLLGRGAAAAGVRGPEGRGPLHWAAHHGMASVARALLPMLPAPEVDAEDAAHEAALLLAARRGFAPVVELLLGAGAAADRPNAQGVTPLMASALFDHADSVGLLLARGASTSAVDAASRRTALHFAALGDAAHAASALLAASADRSLADRVGATAEALAEEAGALRVLELLRGQ